MSAIRNVVLASDLSCKDTFCYGTHPDLKLLDKRTYAVREIPGVVFDSVTMMAPMDASVPATDGIAIGTLADAGFDEIIMADGGIVKEIYDNCVVEWQVTYTDCENWSWEIRNIDLSDINPAGVQLDCSLLTP